MTPKQAATAAVNLLSFVAQHPNLGAHDARRLGTTILTLSSEVAGIDPEFAAEVEALAVKRTAALHKKLGGSK